MTVRAQVSSASPATVMTHSMIAQFLRLTLIGTALLTSLPAQAKVTVEAHDGLLAAKVSEEIVPGDYEALLKGLRAHPGHFTRKIVLLDSLGGSAPEAMRMGRLLRETGFEVLVPSDGLCQGSCIYLLAAGKKRTIKGAVALRRPPFANGDSALAQTAGPRAFVSPASYFREMGVNTSLAEAIEQVPEGRIRLLSQSDLAHYRLQ